MLNVKSCWCYVSIYVNMNIFRNKTNITRKKIWNYKLTKHAAVILV